jgi:hypothetical protein
MSLYHFHEMFYYIIINELFLLIYYIIIMFDNIVCVILFQISMIMKISLFGLYYTHYHLYCNRKENVFFLLKEVGEKKTSYIFKQLFLSHEFK